MDGRQPGVRWSRLGLVALFWTLDGITLAIGSVSALDHRFVTSVVSCQLWIPHTLMAIWMTARWPVERGRVGAVGIHVVAAAVVVITRPLLFVALDPWMRWPGLKPLPELMVNSVRFNLFLYVLIVGAAHAVHYALRARDRERDAERLEAQLTSARLAALRAQLHPHFLFNALGGIAELVHVDPQAADRMIVRLSRLLRIALDERDTHVVTLGHELMCLEPYLELEKMRYGERLTVAMDIEPAARAAWVPGLVLQPIVENAIRHGIAPRTAPGTVTIRASMEGTELWLEVEDDGVGLAPGAAAGIGLRNTRARLAALYGDASELCIDGRPGGGARVRVRVPGEAVVA